MEIWVFLLWRLWLSWCLCFVVAIDIDLRVVNLVDSLRSRGLNDFSLEVDIANREAIKNSVIKSELLLGGGIDILVNSAVIQRRTSSENFSEKDWHDSKGLRENY